MKTIFLRDGVFALVDDSDYESLKEFNWFLFRCKRQTDYAYRYVRDESGKRKRIFMHRQILPHNLPHTDHIDGNGLNNQRSNLRPAFAYQNVANSGIRKNNTSGLKGIIFIKSTGKWRARLGGGRLSHIGVFTDKIEAARAYDEAAVKIYGEFLRPNFPASKPPTEETT